MKKIVVGITGASGAIYGVKLIEILNRSDVESHVVISPSAIRTIHYETDYNINNIESLCSHIYDPKNIGATIASGSFKVDGMIIAPCSIKTLSSIANSYNDNLIARAADVTLKERRKLVLMVRETPFHLGHLKLMQSITEIGGIILPPIPSFYHLPKSIDDIVDHSIGRALDMFNIEANLFERWDGLEEKNNT